MALATYSDLLASVADWIVRSDLTGVIPDFVAIFEARNNRLMRVRQMETSTALTTVSGAVALPTDFLERRSLVWNGDPLQQLEYVAPGMFAERYPVLQTGVPTEYTIRGSTIQIGDYDDTETVTLLYYAKISALSSTTTNWLMTAHPDLYLAGTLVEAYAYVKQYDDASAWRAREDDIRTQIITLDAISRVPASMQAYGSYTP